MVSTQDETGLSQPSDSDFTGRASKHPAKGFKREAETRNSDTRTPPDEFSLGVGPEGKFFHFRGKGDWVKKWGWGICQVALMFGAIAAAYLIREFLP